MEPLAYLERVKIQSEILLPFFKRVREELGAERASELLRAAVAEYGHALGHSVAEASEGSSLEKLGTLMPVFTAGNALEIEPLAQSEQELSLNVHGCKYAEYFQSLGEPEFGAMITCEVDPPLTEAIGSDLTLERSQTILKGGDHCDFRWKMSR